MTKTPTAGRGDANDGAPAPARRLTARGLATRDRMISAAADLMYVKGANAVTLDDIRDATQTSKSQLYKHFPDGKPEIIRAVIALRAEQVLARETVRLRGLRTMRGLRRWRNALVQASTLQGGAYGCSLGALTVEVSDQDETARASLSSTFAAWRTLLADGFRRMQADGTLVPEADPGALATGLLGALQGGYLLAQADHDATSMATALDMALAHIDAMTITVERPAIGGVPAPKLTAAKLRAAIDRGARILDTRSPDDFAIAHLEGSLNIGLHGSMVPTATAVCDGAETVVVIAYPGDEQVVARQLAETGFTGVLGVFGHAAEASFPDRLQDLVRSARRTSPSELEMLLGMGAVTVLDVRGDGDRVCGTIPNAIEIPLDRLHERWDSIPIGKPIVVHCAAGGRSSTAASLLRAHGLHDVSDLTGGFQQWQRSGGAPTTASDGDAAERRPRGRSTAAPRKGSARR